MKLGDRKQFCKRGHLRKNNTHKNGTCKTCLKEVHAPKWNHSAASPAARRRWLHAFTSDDEKRFQECLSGMRPCDFCGLDFALGEIPDIDHDHNCCPTGKHCRKCLRGFVHEECNTRAILWMEWYERKSGITLELLRQYRRKALGS